MARRDAYPLGAHRAMSDELDLKHVSDEFRQMIAKDGDKVVTWRMFAVALDKWKEMNERNKERNARLDALEQRCTALETTSIKHNRAAHTKKILSSR